MNGFCQFVKGGEMAGLQDGPKAGGSACVLTAFESDTARFFSAWAAAPLTVASVVPSSDSLARAMTASLSEADAPVLELGPGTGVFTRAILRRGIAEHDLTLVEAGSTFAQMLESRFPAARILQMDAANLSPSYARYGAVVSGLPLLSMTPERVIAVLSGAFANMRQGGKFFQFTYGLRCPVAKPILDQLGLEAVHRSRVFFNFPPANVFCITRQKQVAEFRATST